MSPRSTWDVGKAAFYALINRDQEVADAIRAVLLAQVRDPGTDFNDRDKYDRCPGDGVWLSFSTWMHHLIYAYDYLRIMGAFSDGECNEIRDWLRGYACWIYRHEVGAFDGWYSDRWNEDWTPRRAAEWRPQWDWHEGPQHTQYRGQMNNRRAKWVLTSGLIGILLDDAELIRVAKQHYKEQIAIGATPEGSMGDFYRGHNHALADLGWAYSMSILSHHIAFTDALARTGDMSLYEWGTIGGAYNTAGPPDVSSKQNKDGGIFEEKNLLWMTQSMLKYYDGTFARYQSGHPDDPARRIDGIQASTGWHGMHFVYTAVGNYYWRSDYVWNMAHGKGPGHPGFPKSPNDGGAFYAFMYPATMLMFGGDATKTLRPYPGKLQPRE